MKFHISRNIIPFYKILHFGLTGLSSVCLAESPSDRNKGFSKRFHAPQSATFGSKCRVRAAKLLPNLRCLGRILQWPAVTLALMLLGPGSLRSPICILQRQLPYSEGGGGFTPQEGVAYTAY
eukprot:28220-Hanusia_phi.AAC.1